MLVLIFLFLSLLGRVENRAIKASACNNYSEIFGTLPLDTNSLIKNLNTEIAEYEVSFSILIFFPIIIQLIFLYLYVLHALFDDNFKLYFIYLFINRKYLSILIQGGCKKM